MVIPPFNQNDWLPEGIYNCTLEEAAKRFGNFQRSDRRPRLWLRLMEFMAEAKACGLVEAVFIDGSFVTGKPDPNDIDLVVVIPANHDFSVELTGIQYDVLAQKKVRKRFGFDIVVVKSASEGLEHAVAFFQQVRQRPGEKKGILKITL